MNRRINHTDRKRISSANAKVSLTQSGGAAASFWMDLKLHGYKLPPNARIHVEAYRQTSWMRFDFGTVENPVVPNDRALKEFDGSDDIRFRVKVTSADPPRGRLLAIADKLQPVRVDEDANKRIPLLPVKPDDLDGEVWRLEIDEDHVRLLVNQSAGDVHSVARSPEFLTLVYPSVLREILTRTLLIEKCRDFGDENDEEDWRSQWLQFARSLPGVEAPPVDEDDAIRLGDWINETVSSFCRKSAVMDRFAELAVVE